METCLHAHCGKPWVGEVKTKKRPVLIWAGEVLVRSGMSETRSRHCRSLGVPGDPPDSGALEGGVAMCAPWSLAGTAGISCNEK